MRGLAAVHRHHDIALISHHVSNPTTTAKEHGRYRPLL